MTWHQAKQYCQQTGAQLAEPTDEYMSRFIANIFPHEYPNNQIRRIMTDTLEVIIRVGKFEWPLL